MRLAAYIRVSRDDERLENQEYAVYRWAAEKGHQIIEAVRDVVSRAPCRLPRGRGGRGLYVFGVLLEKARRFCKSVVLQKFCKEEKGAGGGI
jgi:hypothetical protein